MTGQYRVHITDSLGEVVEAGPAFLNVAPRGITFPLEGLASVYPAEITVDTPGVIQWAVGGVRP